MEAGLLVLVLVLVHSPEETFKVVLRTWFWAGEEWNF